MTGVGDMWQCGINFVVDFDEDNHEAECRCVVIPLQSTTGCDKTHIKEYDGNEYHDSMTTTAWKSSGSLWPLRTTNTTSSSGSHPRKQKYLLYYPLDPPKFPTKSWWSCGRTHYSWPMVWSFFCGCLVGGSLVAVVGWCVASALCHHPPHNSAAATVTPSSLMIPTSTTTTASMVRSSSGRKDDSCQISLGHYQGREARPDPNDPLGKSIQCLVNTKFLKLQLHTHVVVPSNKNKNGKKQEDKIIDDWVWIDYHDRINVLVQTVDGDFMILQQTKYALEGRQSLAIVGGIVEPGEDPHRTAQREVLEELRHTCHDYHFLGRFVTDVNRGMGWLNSFLATGCRPADETGGHPADSSSSVTQVGAADTEVQLLQRMTLPQVQQAYEAGKFLEAQWSATIGLALRHPSLVVVNE